MAGKGSHRRPSNISADEYTCNYDRIFKGVKPEIPIATQIECTAIVKRSDVWPLNLGSVDLTDMDNPTACKYLVGGMRVKLLCKARSQERGWGQLWLKDKERYIGKVLTVEKISTTKGVYCVESGFWFPAFCLQIIEQENNNGCE